MVLSTPSTHETKSKHTRIKVFSIIVSKHKKALMLCIKAFPCRHIGEKVEAKSSE